MINRPIAFDAHEATELWVTLLDALINSPEASKSSPRGEPTRELLNVTLCLRNGRRPVVRLPERLLNYHFMVAEWAWIALGREDVASISHYNKQISRFSDDGHTFFGAYGPRWLSQLDYVVKKLRTDYDSRQAVATIWRPNPPGTKDVPCTVAMQYIIRDDRLNAIVTMRSSDVWLGVPYDIFNFSMLANIVAGEVGVPLGEIRIQLGSSHMYDRDAAAAARVLGAYNNNPLHSPTMPQLPGRWPPGSNVWWTVATTGHVGTAMPPWSDFLVVLADRALNKPELVNGPFGLLMSEQRPFRKPNPQE